MALQVPPLISPAELALDLPASRESWCSRTAKDWRHIYLKTNILGPGKSIPIAQCTSSISQIREQHNVDTLFSMMVVVYCTWAIVWNNEQLRALLLAQPMHQSSESTLALSSWDNGLGRLLEQLCLILSDWQEVFRPELTLVFERTLLNSHISFENVQLFAGKEGEEEARRTYPILQNWSNTNEARKAIWHAGQVLKAASECPPKHLRDFQAVCVYHASIAFWAYAVVSASSKVHTHSQIESGATRELTASTDSEVVWMNGNDSPAVQRFIALNRGIPVVCDLRRKQGLGDAALISLQNPKEIMNLCIDILKTNSSISGDDTLLPLVDNLSQLMRDLGTAAQQVLERSSHRQRE